MISLQKWNPNQSAYLFYESEHIYWILDLEREVRSIWDYWISDHQKCKDNGFFQSRVGQGGQSFRLGPKNVDFFLGEVASPVSTSPEKARRGRFNIRHRLMRI